MPAIARLVEIMIILGIILLIIGFLTHIAILWTIGIIVLVLGLIAMLLGEQQTELAAQLQSALNSRAIIEQAKGVLIGQQGLTAHDAYARLRSQARAERRKLAIVSAEVVRGAIRADGN